MLLPPLLLLLLAAATASAAPQQTEPAPAASDVEETATPVDTLQRVSKEDSLLYGRDKERRIQEIKGYIYNTTRPRKANATSLPSLEQPPSAASVDTKLLNGLVSNMAPAATTAGNFPKKFTSFHPVCSPPLNKKVEAAKGPDDMFMLFELTYPEPLTGYKIEIDSAKLRLFKIYQQSNSSAAVVASEPTATSANVTEATSTQPPASSTPSTVIDLIPNAKEVRVTVSYLVRQQHKKGNKLSRILLDSKMVSMWGDGWVELNVSKAVREWRNASANLGLFVMVEDLESNKLPPPLFFKEMNCSVDTAKPVPSVVLDAALASDPSAASLASSATPASAQMRAHMLPVISLVTAELPAVSVSNATTAFFPLTGQESSDEFRKYIINYARRASTPATPTSTTAAEAHPRRHRNRHHTQPEDAVGRQLRQMALRRNSQLFHDAAPAPTASASTHASNHQHLQLLVLQTSKVAEVDDDVQHHHQQPIALDKLFQR